METIQDKYIDHETHSTFLEGCSTCWSENLILKSKERDIQMKCNGLSSSTKFEVFDLGRGIKQEWHEHPETGELVIVDTWYVSSGDGDVMPEFEVIKVFPPVGCELAKFNKGHNINKPIK